MFSEDTKVPKSVSFPNKLLEMIERCCFNEDINFSSFVVDACKEKLLHKSDTPDVWELLYKLMNYKSR